MASTDVFVDLTTSHDGDEWKRVPQEASLVTLQPDDDFDWEAYM
jgi:hypothetical protein